jgi:hypothetical protein
MLKETSIGSRIFSDGPEGKMATKPEQNTPTWKNNPMKRSMARR